MTDRLAWAVGELARLATSEFDADDLLTRLCDVAAEALPVDGVGVMRVVGDATRFVRATADQGVIDIERMQESQQQGPCRQAIDSGVPVFVGRPADMEWPGFQDHAERAGLHAVYAVPLLSRGRAWGSLDLYWRSPHVLTETDRTAARLLADVAVSYLVMAADRAESLAVQDRLARRVLHDELTGLPNRSLMHELLHHALASAERRGTLVALLFVDVDRFKAVNDVFGHRTGDLVLELVGSRLTAAVRSSDVVGRLSGDEFLVLCDDIDADDGTVERLLVLGDDVRSAVAAPIVVEGRHLQVSASVGIAVASGRIAAAQLLHVADTAMYLAKGQGRNRVVLRQAEDQLTDLRNLERSLFDVVVRGELRLHYQPIVSAGHGSARPERVMAVEALVRWEHPELGMLNAVEFIDLAEAGGAILEIGHWVIGEALSQLRAWENSVPGHAPRIIFCNLSPRQLVSPDLLPVIDRALTAHGFTADRLGLEILEDNLDDPRLIPALDNLQRAGHPLAVDDFGTGYSSLHRLVELPVTHVKLDRSLVQGLPSDPKSRTLFRAILTVAAALGVEVICEGVETAEQAEHLRNAGADLLQGYHFGRPTDGTTLGVRLAASAP